MSQESADLIDYYSARAAEYDEIYFRIDLIRQGELKNLIEDLTAASQGKHVLELASGTGYWTEVLGRSAASVVAVDASPAMLEIARAKGLPGNVEFKIGDAYHTDFPDASFDLVVAIFWYSHIPHDKLDHFLGNVTRLLKSNGSLILIDNLFATGVGGTLVAESETLDTFKVRTLNDGREWKIIKNYPSEDELKTYLNKHFIQIEYHHQSCYWQVTASNVKSHQN